MIVISSKPGQLGNRLFLFAQFVALASEYGVTVVNPSFDEYARYFQTTSRDLFCRYPPRKSLLKGRAAARKALYHACYYLTRALVQTGVRLRSLRAVALGWEEEFDLEDAEFLSSLEGRRQLIFMQGWLFRTRRAGAKHAEAVRNFFEPRAEFRANVAALIRRAREGCDVLVGVHIRHGDYRTWQGGRFFHELQTYAALMERAEALWPDSRVSFLVCSNAAHDAALFSRFRYVNGNNHLIEDMYSFAACDYIIGPPSTYTMWASFYGKVPLYLIADASREPTLADFVVYDIDGIVKPENTGDAWQAGRETETPA